MPGWAWNNTSGIRNPPGTGISTRGDDPGQHKSKELSRPAGVRTSVIGGRHWCWRQSCVSLVVLDQCSAAAVGALIERDHWHENRDRDAVCRDDFVESGAMRR